VTEPEGDATEMSTTTAPGEVRRVSRSSGNGNVESSANEWRLRDLVDGLNGCGGATDFHGELAGVSAKSVTVDLNFVVAVLVASVCKTFRICGP